MALVYADRVKETTTSTGTGTINLAGAATGFQTFVAGIGNGNTVKYCITDGTDWEVGEGTVTDATPDTLSRTTIHSSSNAGSAVNWGAGTKDVFGTLPAADFPAAGGGGAWNLIQTQTVTSSVASVDFTTGIDDTYDHYILLVGDVKPVNNNDNLLLRVSSDGGSTWLSGGSYRHGTETRGGGVITDNFSNTETSAILSRVISNSGFYTASGVVHLRNFRSVESYPIFNVNVSNPSGAKATTEDGTIMYASGYNAKYNAIQLRMSTGNLAQGTFSLYGISK